MSPRRLVPTVLAAAVIAAGAGALPAPAHAAAGPPPRRPAPSVCYDRVAVEQRFPGTSKERTPSWAM